MERCTRLCYVINCVSDLRQVGGFLWVSSTSKADRHDIAEIFLKFVFIYLFIYLLIYLFIYLFIYYNYYLLLLLLFFCSPNTTKWYCCDNYVDDGNGTCVGKRRLLVCHSLIDDNRGIPNP